MKVFMSVLVVFCFMVGQAVAEDSVCSGQVGAAFGLCNAYCEAMNCDDSFDAQASEVACGKVKENFYKITGQTEFPCENPIEECLVPGWSNVLKAVRTNTSGLWYGESVIDQVGCTDLSAQTSPDNGYGDGSVRIFFEDGLLVECVNAYIDDPSCDGEGVMRCYYQGFGDGKGVQKYVGDGFTIENYETCRLQLLDAYDNP